MSWTVFSDAIHTGFRGFEEDGGFYVMEVPSKSNKRPIEVDSKEEFSLHMLKELGSRQSEFFRSVKISGELPNTLENFIKYKAETVEYIEVDDDNIFQDVSDMSDDQKHYFDWLYKQKIKLPNLVSIDNKLMGIFVSAGFVTALVAYSVTITILLTLLTFIAIGSLLVAVTQVRTEVTDGSVFELFKSAVEGQPHASDDAQIYVVPNVIKSPFTLPIGKQAVYFPQNVIGDLTSPEIKSVIEHELGHHKNKANSSVIFIVNFLSGLVIAPPLILFTELQPNFAFFVLISALLLSIQIAQLYLGRRDEIIADNQVSNPSDVIAAIVKLSPEVYHTQTKLQLWVHRLFDVHPPMNKRIKHLYPNAHMPSIGKTSWSPSAWLGAILSIIGSILIGYGFLAFTSSNVSELYLFYGTIITLFSMIPRYLSDSIMSVIVLAFALALSFGVTIGIGYLLGADGIVEAVAVGRLGRRVTFTFFLLIGVTIFFLSTLYYDYSPDISHSSLQPSPNWEIEDSFGHRNTKFYRQIYSKK